LANGNIAVSSIHEDDKIYVQILDKNLLPLSEKTMVNKSTSNVNYNKAIASSSNHRLVIVWSGEQPNTKGMQDIFYKQSVLDCKVFKDIESCELCLNET